jgi:hypothetical protein
MILQTTKLSAWRAKGRTVTTMEHMQFGLSVLAAECGITKLALTPQTCMINIASRNIMLKQYSNYELLCIYRYEGLFYLFGNIFCLLSHTHTHTHGGASWLTVPT